jgi:hypothetical protein
MEEKSITSFTFLVNHSSELFLFNPLCKIIKNLNPLAKINLCIPLSSKRNLHLKKQDFIFFDKIVDVPDLNFTKNILKLYKNFFKTIRALNSVEKDSKLIIFEPHSLLSIIAIDFFNKNTIIISSNFKESIFNSLQIDFSKTFLYSLNLFLLFKKGLKYGFYKTTFYPIIDIKIKCHLHLVFGDTDFSKNISSNKKVRLNNHPALANQTFINTDGFFIIIIDMEYLSVNKKYKRFMIDLINYLKNTRLSFKLKDHPLSLATDKQLKSLFLLNDENFINKSTDVETYILRNRPFIRGVIGPSSTVLRSCHFLNISNICITGVFEQKKDYIEYMQNYFKNSNTEIVFNFEEIKIKIKNAYFKNNIKEEDDYSFLM